MAITKELQVFISEWVMSIESLVKRSSCGMQRKTHDQKADNMSDRKWAFNVRISVSLAERFRRRVEAIKRKHGLNATSLNKEAEKALIIGLRELEQSDDKVKG